MTFQEIMAMEDFDKKLAALKQWKDDNIAPVDKETNEQEYDGEHSILWDPAFKDETIGTGDNMRLVKKAKIIIRFQRKVVESAVAFLFGKPVTLSVDSEDTYHAFQKLKDTWKDKKLDFFNRKLMRAVCVETEAAELWDFKKEAGKPYEITVQLLKESNDEYLYPFFDSKGKMQAFVHQYNLLDNGKNYEVVQIYTSEKIIRAVKDSTWEIQERPNIIGKIPVVYYRQDEKEWASVDSIIERLERMVSRHAGTNDYYSAPIAKIKGKLKKMPDKEQDGKTLFFEPELGPDGKPEYGDADYLTWDQSPESLKLEFLNLMDLAYNMTDTPNVTLDNLKGIGNYSGVALKLMFMSPLMKAMNKQEIYGEGLERRINILKAILAFQEPKLEKEFDDLQINVTFNSILPESQNEILENLTIATGGKAVMSQETGVRKNPLVTDPDGEIDKLKSESVQNLGESFNV